MAVNIEQYGLAQVYRTEPTASLPQFLRPAAEALALGQVFGTDSGKFPGKSVSVAGGGRSDAGVSGFDLGS